MICQHFEIFFNKLKYGYPFIKEEVEERNGRKYIFFKERKIINKI